MERTVPIQTLHLFPVLDKLLIELLRSLKPEDWNKPTIGPLWTVKDIAAHLLDTNMRAISSADGYSGKPPENINSYSDLVNYLNELNAVWVKAMDRVSPQQLITMLETTGPQYVCISWHRESLLTGAVGVHGQGRINQKTGLILPANTPKNGITSSRYAMQLKARNNEPGIVLSLYGYFYAGLPHTYRNVTLRMERYCKSASTQMTVVDWYLQKQKQAGTY